MPIWCGNTGARARRRAVVENDKLKVQIQPNQTVGHLKGLISNATRGVQTPFELQKHGAEGSDAFDDDDTLSDVGLVSGSVVRVPVHLVDIYFVLPPGDRFQLTNKSKSKPC